MQSYFTIDGAYEHTIEINRSVFICHLKGIKSFEEAQEFVKEKKKTYSSATHNCYAIMTIDSRQKFSDDGEPSGTAGQPILQALKNNDLNNIVAVVTRYFGGVKLGASGLVTAYAKSVADTISISKKVNMLFSQKGEISLEYSELSAVNNFIKSSNYLLLDTQYTDNITIEFACPVEEKEKIESYFCELTSGKGIVKWLEKDYYIYV